VSLRDDLLSDVDDIRGIPGELGVRLFSVSVLVRTWTGARPNAPGSTKTDVVTPIKTGLGAQDVKVRNLTSRDVIASGGAYNDQDLEIGPITPPFPGVDEGNAISEWETSTTTTAREVFYLVEGPGTRVGGDLYYKINTKTDRAFRYVLTLRRVGATQ